jgi:hypothetical protein
LDGRIKLLAGTIDEIARAIERAIALRMLQKNMIAAVVLRLR